MFFIRQNATHLVVLGPAVAVGDGFTPVTNLAASRARAKAGKTYKGTKTSKGAARLATKIGQKK